MSDVHKPLQMRTGRCVRNIAEALQDVRDARAAWRAWRDSIPNKLAAFPFEVLPQPYTRRAAWVMAKHALYNRARLPPEDHAIVVDAFNEFRDSEAIPPEVAQYLGQPAPSHRPRRPVTASKERRACHLVWLVGGYYRQKKVHRPIEKARAVAALIVAVSPSQVFDWWRANRIPLWGS